MFLNKGDTIGIVSPSAPVTDELKEQFNKGLKVLEDMGFNILLSKNVFSNSLGYSASINEKIEDLHEMFKNKDLKAIICSQGGQNSNTILPYLDYELIKNNPKIIFGISDATALLNAIYTKTKIITYHQNDLIWGMGIEANKDEMEDFKLRLVDGQKGEIKHFTDSWKCLRKGTCEGTLIGGNLSTLVKLLNTEYCPNFKDCILFLEEFAEESPLDEVDSKINILKQQGIFNQIKGLWIGYYEKDTEKVKYEDAVMNNVKEYKFPILKCNDFGHDCSNVVIPIGAKARLTADECKVELL